MWYDPKPEIKCAICNRIVPDVYTEKHHLIPDCEGGKEKVTVCIDCGDQIHQLFTEHELRDHFNTVELLKTHLKVQKWIQWIRKQKTFGMCMKKKKKR
jgi:hypothetical protein